MHLLCNAQSPLRCQTYQELGYCDTVIVFLVIVKNNLEHGITATATARNK